MKTPNEMNYEEFVNYFTINICNSIVTTGFSELHCDVKEIINEALENKIFGGMGKKYICSGAKKCKKKFCKHQAKHIHSTECKTKCKDEFGVINASCVIAK